MTAAHGQILRYVGLLLEALCVLGLLSVRGGRFDFLKRSGMDPSTVLMIGLALGFGLWVVGTFVIQRERLKRKSRGSD